jgi:hypothetical protein
MGGGLRGTDGLSPGCLVSPFLLERGLLAFPYCTQRGDERGVNSEHEARKRGVGLDALFFSKARMLYSPLKSPHCMRGAMKGGSIVNMRLEREGLGLMPSSPVRPGCSILPL